MKRFLFLLLSSATVFRVSASHVSFDTPTTDRWMYPFNSTPGTRSSAPVFGAPGTEGFDERDGQFLVGFDTSGEIQTGLGASAYRVTSATLTLRHDGGDFVYDPTTDGYQTYLDSGASGYQADSDAGRPLELFGAGYRNGYDAESFGETGAFGPGAPAAGTRNVYPVGFDGNGNAVDVSNSLDYAHGGANGFTPVSFGVGTAVGLSAGDTVTAGTEFVFDLNLSSPWVEGFLREQLHGGNASFVVASFHPASQGGPAIYPSFETKENIVGQSGTLHIEYDIVPEPETFGLMLFAGLLLYRFRFHRRDGA